MDSLKEYLENDILGRATSQIREREGMCRFSQYLHSDVPTLWPILLSRFVRDTPWRYWDPNLVDNCLSILENDIQKTADAFEERSSKLGLGIENLFRRSPLADYEERLSHDNPHDLVRIATEFHPEYVRYAEHIFGNLLVLYWSLLKKKSVKGHYDIRGATALLEDKGYGHLLAGYRDYIRNAIAHGEVFFNGFSIRYGWKHENKQINELSSSEFLSEFDQLYRTSNALAIGIFLYLARNLKKLAVTKAPHIPTSIITLLAAAGIERPGLEVIGTVESEIGHIGHQLHIAIKSSFRARTVVMADAVRLSAHLLQNGAINYSRFLIQIDHGEAVTSLIIILPEKLNALLNSKAPLDKISEVFYETQLLWFDESSLSRKYKTWKLLFLSHFKLTLDDIRRQWWSLGIRQGVGRYRMRKIKNISASGIPRLEIRVVLLYPEDAGNKDIIRKIVREAIKKASRMWINSAPGPLEKKIPWPAHPKIIGIYLHKADGTIRYLEKSGWFSGNLVVVAEKVKGFRRKAIFVPQPEEIWKGIRFRYQGEMQQSS